MKAYFLQWCCYISNDNLCDPYKCTILRDTWQGDRWLAQSRQTRDAQIIYETIWSWLTGKWDGSLSKLSPHRGWPLKLIVLIERKVVTTVKKQNSTSDRPFSSWKSEIFTWTCVTRICEKILIQRIRLSIALGRDVTWRSCMRLAFLGSGKDHRMFL